MIVGLASPRVAASLDDGLERVRRLLSEAADQGAEIVCFPEAYLPGLRGLDFDVGPFDRAQQEDAVEAVAQWARTSGVATILGMEKTSAVGRQIVAVVIDAQGLVLGHQTKNQLDPSEERNYVPGTTRAGPLRSRHRPRRVAARAPGRPWSRPPSARRGR